MRSLHTLLSHPVVCRFVLLRFVGMACGLTGCVPSTAYEQAASAAEVEREGHRRAAEKLAKVERELGALRTERDRLSREKDELSQRLSRGESQLAQVSLDVEAGRKEAEQQTELVTQLRGELARVGVHMKSFAGEKSELEEKLEQTQQALEERDARIATLEKEVAGLKANADQAAEAQDQLENALSELSSLQDQVGSTEDESAANDGAPAPDDEPREVLPAEEAEPSP